MDREKVITGLELCTNISQDGCLMLCPYKDEKDETYSGFCEHVLKQDVIALLKEQEAEIERLQPKKGKWYQQLSKCPSAINNGGSRTQKCSLCGGLGKKTFAFCPHCGADMREGDGNEAD